MSLETAFRQHLADSTPLTALVSTRIVPLRGSTKEAAPYIVYQVISRVSVHHATNPDGTTGASGLAQTRVQVRSVADTTLDATALANAVRNRIQGYRGVLGSGANQLRCEYCTMENEFDDEPFQLEGSERYVYSRIQDFSIWHPESIPTLA